jgi:hypothetical protein
VPDTCPNCGADLEGRWCSACGQKCLVEGDRRFGHLVGQFIDAATDLDGRFWGSLRALLFQPGRLSRDYIDGRRARWMSPVALFLLVNVVYFVFVQESDFAVPFTWEVPGRIILEVADSPVDPAEVERLRDDPGPLHSRLTAPLVDRRVAARDAAARESSDGRHGYSYADYRQAYEAKVPEVSKAMAILHVPFLALALLLMFRRRPFYYAEHFVVALHLLAFNMATIQIVLHATDLLYAFVPRADWHNSALNWVIRFVMTVYVIVALRRAYRVAWHWAVAATIGLFAAYIVINFYLYRPALFLIVFALT